jgi:hypothetical protein
MHGVIHPNYYQILNQTKTGHPHTTPGISTTQVHFKNVTRLRFTIPEPISIAPERWTRKRSSES